MTKQLLQVRPIFLLVTCLVLISLSFGLALVSNGFLSAQGWFSFLLVSLVAIVLLVGGWQLIRREAAPAWLLQLMVGAALLRLFAGVFWLVVLPAAGYDSSPEQHGYVMADAYDRDRTAWDLAQSDKPLFKAFQGSSRKADQYGGLLFLSSAIYRYTAAPVHQPLLMTVLTAAFSSLAVLFIWGYTRRLWGESAASLAAWGLALYPEAVLLGSSQMREAFTITLAIAASYGLLTFTQARDRVGLALVVGALLLSLPLSPPSAALLLIVLILQAMAMRGELFYAGSPDSTSKPGSAGLSGSHSSRRRQWLWLIGAGIIALIIAGLWQSLLQFTSEGTLNPRNVVTWWMRAANWNAHLSERASGWMQKMFLLMPDWAHAPMLILYGIVQPFLPAALIDVTGAPIWRLIAVWRSVGWTLLLPLLIYASLRALRNGTLERALSLGVWLVILVASFRGGGDAWDNPRYRLTFAGLQLALAAWAWAEQRRVPDPWLRRVLVGAGMVFLWFVPWYLHRYVHFNWAVVDLFKLLGLGIASAVLYWIGDIAGEAAKKGYSESG